MKMKILDFKSISPFFEQCRDGQKMFDVRKHDGKDRRFRTLSHLPDGHRRFDGFYLKDWSVKFTNPVTGEQFTRKLLFWEYLAVTPSWVILYLGEKVENGT